MQMYVYSFLAAATVTALMTPLARRLAFRFHVVSSPGGRHIHGQVIPRLGGVAIFVGAVLATAGGVVFGGLREFLAAEAEWQGLGLLFGGSLMFAVGAWDDVKQIPAVRKLAVQVMAAAVAWIFGFRIDVVDLPLLGAFSMGVFSLPVTVFWIVGIINAVNLIDGLDGLAAGVVFFAGVTNFVVAYLLGTTFVALVMATLAGAVLGFLFFNFNPARIFMGDSGSYFLGFVLACCSIAGPLQKASAAVSIAVPIVALGVPIIDTLLAMVRRFLERRPLFSPDRGHIHHRLIDMGITHRRAVLIIYGITVALCVGAIGIAFGRNWEVGAAVLGVSALLFGLIRFIGYFEYLAVAARQKKRINSRHVEWLRKVILLLPGRFSNARTEAEVLTVLGWLAKEARFDVIEVRDCQGDASRVMHAFRGDDYQDMDRRDITVSELPLATVEGPCLRFEWRSEFGEVPPQMDILLQLVVDATSVALVGVGSDLVQRAQVAGQDSRVVSLEPAYRR